MRAMILKGDARARGRGRARRGRLLSTPPPRLPRRSASLPPDLAAELARAERFVAEHFRALARDSWRIISPAPASMPAHRSARFQESIDILLEEKQVYFQQPSAYFFPGLPQIQFYEREEFAWVAAVEAATGAMRDELEAALQEDGLFRPYLQSRQDRPSYDFHGLLDNPAWSTLYLWENGGPVEKNVARCPRTFAAMQDVPLPHITTRAPSILFSLLKPGARIAAHNGMINTRLICHLPLIVPPGCGFRVGNETREWEVGKLLIFDDTIEHEAWNDSGEDRVVLIFDVWRPELTADERRAVTAIFEAIDTGGGAAA